MTGAFRDAPGSAAKTIKPEASHTKPGRTLLQVKTKNKKNEVEGGTTRPARRQLLVIVMAFHNMEFDSGMYSWGWGGGVLSQKVG